MFLNNDTVYTGGSKYFDENTGRYRDQSPSDETVYTGGSKYFDENTGRYRLAGKYAGKINAAAGTPTPSKPGPGRPSQPIKGKPTPTPSKPGPGRPSQPMK